MMSVTRSIKSLPRLLSVTPWQSLIDSKVIIKATGVESNGPVTLRSVCEQDTRTGRVKFEGHAHYIADANGVVSVPDQMSLGGTYTGAEPMGLFWSMQLSAGQRLGSRFLVKDVTKPARVDLMLYRGHLDTETLQTAEPETTATAEKFYMGKNVERIPINSGHLTGTLFKPKGAGPFPGVIDLFGAIGGLVEIRASMLASHGIACYALPYYSFKDKKPHLWEIDLDRFQDAIDWLSGQPFVKPGGIGLVGVSVGGSLALASASYFPSKIKAVICINGCHVRTSYSLVLKGEKLSFTPSDLSRIKPTTIKGVNRLFDALANIYDVTQDDDVVLKLENAPHCQFMFITSENDAMWDSSYFAQQAMRRLARHGCHNYQLLSYPNAGHLIEIPYAPVGVNIYFPFGGVLEQGGSIAGTAAAMADSWPKIISFLHTHCGRPV